MLPGREQILVLYISAGPVADVLLETVEVT
jgi:hypothetical protein